MATNEEIFFKHAGCRKCKMKANYCECEIGEPYGMLAQCDGMMKDAREDELKKALKKTEADD